jgi:GAF domain-containing protein
VQVLSVPLRLARQPVGTLNAYATQPRAWSTEEVEALGAFAAVTAELVRTGVEQAEATLQAAQAGLARRAAALDRAQDSLDERERAADERNHLADERDRAAKDEGS